jgi:hypothetical protein
MVDIYFNENYDMTLLNRDMRITTESEIVAQRLETRLQFIFGEWFLDTSQGLPYPQNIFEEGLLNTDALYALFRTEIANTPGVTNINSLTLDINRDERELTINLEVNDGVTVVITPFSTAEQPVWILAAGVWNDEGTWIDSALWIE